MRYGGNTSCVEVRLADGTLVIFDGGTGIRALGARLVEEEPGVPMHLCVTHVHWDHIIGIPFFAPIYRKETRLTLHQMLMESPSHVLSPEEIFDGQHFPLRMHQLPCTLIRPLPTELHVPWRIGSAEVTRVALNHPGGSTGYRVDDADGASLCFLTDNELSPPGARQVSTVELARFARGAGLLVHDAQYLEEDMAEKRGWGHSTIWQVLDLGRLAEVRTLVLYHHDPERHDDALDVIGTEAAVWWQARVGAGQVLVAREGLTLNIEK
jgi:phosphoribosyl 1,2-cyclic phosphodiesterase